MTPLDEARDLLAEAHASLIKHVRHVQASPGVGKSRQDYALAVLNDVEIDLLELIQRTARHAALASPPTAGTESFLEMARALPPLPTSVMATSIPPVVGCCDEWRTARQHHNLCPLMLANRVDVAKQRTEARTVEAIATWLEAWATDEDCPLAAEDRSLLRDAADEIRAGCWRPNPESKEG